MKAYAQQNFKTRGVRLSHRFPASPREQSISPDEEHEEEKRRECVTELHDANGCDKTTDSLDLGDGSSDDEGKSPVDNDHSCASGLEV